MKKLAEAISNEVSAQITTAALAGTSIEKAQERATENIQARIQAWMMTEDCPLFTLIEASIPKLRNIALNENCDEEYRLSATAIVVQLTKFKQGL